jgi:hypothetical protein
MLFSILILSFTTVIGSTMGQVMHNLLLSMELEKLLTIYDSTTFAINIIIKVGFVIFFGMTGFLIAIAISVVIKNFAKAHLLLKCLNKYKL